MSARAHLPLVAIGLACACLAACATPRVSRPGATAPAAPARVVERMHLAQHGHGSLAYFAYCRPAACPQVTPKRPAALSTVAAPTADDLEPASAPDRQSRADRPSTPSTVAAHRRGRPSRRRASARRSVARPDRCARRASRATQHLVNVSGGKDSTAVYLLALESGRSYRAVFADTGNEHELTYEYVARLHARTGGPKVETVRADFTRQLAQHREYVLRAWPAQGIAQAIVEEAAALHEPTGNPFLDLCISKGRFPSRTAQFCTSELKEIPITTQMVGPMLAHGPVLQWLGIRAAESARRASQPRLNRHESGSMLWRPILRWSVEDVWAQHRRHGLPPNPLYALGMARVGCMPCVHCRKSELRAIAERFPEHIDRIEAWERIVAAASKQRGATFFPAVTDPMDAERPGTYGRIRSVVEWSRTSRGGRQFDLFFEQQSGGGCSSDLGLCERAQA